MLDEIIKFYNENVSYYSLVFSYIKGIYITFFVSIFLIVLSFIIFVITVSMKTNDFLSVVFLILSLVFMGIIFLLLNSKAKKVLKSKHNIESNRFIWKCEAFEEKQNKLLMSYLKQKGILSEKKIKLLIDLYKNEAKNSKLPSFIAPGLLLGLFIPAWVQFLNIYFKQVTDVKTAIILTASIFAFVFILVQSLGFIKMLYNEIVDPIINKKSFNINEITACLEIVLLKLPDDKCSLY